MQSDKTLSSLIKTIADNQAALAGAIEDLNAWALERRMIAEAPTVKSGTSNRGEPVMVGEWFRPDLLPYIFGISVEAARKYRSGGLWLEGKHWRTDPANRIVYSRQAIEAWMGGTL